MRQETHKEENNNCYGDASRKVEIESSEAHVAFVRVLKGDVPMGEVCINGGFVYAIKHKPL